MLQNLLVLSLLLFCNYGVEGKKATKEDLELERQLKLLNKPAIKTIQTEHGVYDCVDINKQPAFDNPLLKNHKVQMQPTSLQLQAADKDSSGLRSEDIELKDGGCPMGTVPIRRTTKEDLIKSKQFFGNGVSVPPSSSQIAAVGVSGGEAYYGTDFSLNIWNPPVKTQSYSSMAAVIQYASEIVQAGWLVHPGLFGDNQTHLHTFWAAGTRGPGCFNVQCPGFVQVNPAIPLGGLLTPYSTYLGPQYEAKVRLAMDLTTGDWWLFVGADNKNVGYWPKSLFCHLSGGASQVSWTGVAAARPGLKFPPMGSGYFAEEGTGRSCYFRKVLVMDRIGIFREMDQRLMYSGADSEHYTVKYTHQGGGWGWTMYIGGPGGWVG
ncbi:protein neprosin-like [Aristolochia californica]|uniref:protein neprosin-like n=1 Tax=Aristolochia californica TaxID=171875 RepID=UPI0035E259EF